MKTEQTKSESVRYFDAAHHGHHAGSSHPADFERPYGRYSVYGLAKAEFDEAIESHAGKTIRPSSSPTSSGSGMKTTAGRPR